MKIIFKQALRVRSKKKQFSIPALIWLTPQPVEFVENFFRQPKGLVDGARVAKKLMILDSWLECGLDECGVIHKV